MDFFFKNPGKIIKTLAIIDFFVAIILAFLCGGLCMAQGGWFVLLGFLIIPAVAFIFYIPVLFLYAIGELVEKSTQTEENTRALLVKMQNEGPYYEMPQKEQPAQSRFKSNIDDSLIDYVIGKEEDRVESLAKESPTAAAQLKLIQQMCEDGTLSKEQYFNELKKL